MVHDNYEVDHGQYDSNLTVKYNGRVFVGIRALPDDVDQPETLDDAEGEWFWCAQEGELIHVTDVEDDEVTTMWYPTDEEWQDSRDWGEHFFEHNWCYLVEVGQ